MSESATSVAFPGWPVVFARLFGGEDLSRELAGAAFGEVLAGRAEPAQIAAFVAALRTKGESVEEVTGMLEMMRAHGESVRVIGPTLDTCGTGGDRSGTINVSTMAALICAGAELSVCKHGNRAASSQAGSADVLEALGVAIALGPAGVERCLEQTHIGFCFAPRYHPAMRFAGPVRSQIGVATVFNVLGPLANPARASHQVVGVGFPAMAATMLGVLEQSGTTHSMVLYGHDGLDELSTVQPSTIFETERLSDGSYERKQYVLSPSSLGIAPAKPADLVGGDVAHNAARVRAILSGEKGPQRDVVLLNTAAAFVVTGRAPDFETGLGLAAATVDDGAALHALELLVSVSNQALQDGLG